MDAACSSGQDCPFKGLPIELRLMIYRTVFRGSRITYVNRKGQAQQNLSPSERRRGSAFIATDHWVPLLTCRHFYYEGLAEYWHETRLDATRAGIAELTEHLSDPAKAHVRHIRRLELPLLEPVKRIGLPLEDATAVSRCLAQYEELRTCELHIATTNLAREISREVEAPKLAPGKVHEGVVFSADPRRLLQEYHLVKDGVRFVAQLDIMRQVHRRIAIPLDQFNIHGIVVSRVYVTLFPLARSMPAKLVVQITFLDLTTGKFRSVLWEGNDDVSSFYYLRISRELRHQWDEKQYETLLAGETGVHSHHDI